jgi:hypothetical protein
MRQLAPIALGLSAVALVVAVLRAQDRVVSFDDDQSLAEMTVQGDVTIDTAKNREGEGGGALKTEPGAEVRWTLREANGAGTVEMWVYDDGSAPADPKERGAGPMWGLIQEQGPVLTVGAVYAPYLSGDETYATSEFDPAKDERPWWQVQYLGLKREPGWHKWTFELDADDGLRILCDDRDVNERNRMFNWDRTALRGFTGVVIFGDTTAANQVVWIDDMTITLGGAVNTRPIWPPPPPASSRLTCSLAPGTGPHADPLRSLDQRPRPGRRLLPDHRLASGSQERRTLQGSRLQSVHRPVERSYRRAVDGTGSCRDARHLRPERGRTEAH